MTYLSIRMMNQSMVAREWLREAREKETMSQSTEPVYYWHIYRKTLKGKGKHGDGLKFTRDFTGTKAQVAALWIRYFQTGDYRLRCLLKY